jgi:hypothetical protein
MHVQSDQREKQTGIHAALEGSESYHRTYYRVGES